MTIKYKIDRYGWHTFTATKNNKTVINYGYFGDFETAVLMLMIRYKLKPDEFMIVK